MPVTDKNGEDREAEVSFRSGVEAVLRALDPPNSAMVARTLTDYAMRAGERLAAEATAGDFDWRLDRDAKRAATAADAARTFIDADRPRVGTLK